MPGGVKLGFMTGGALLGLVLLSKGWFFFLGGLAANYQALRTAKRGLGPWPGVVGSLAVFFSLPWLARYGIEVRWPWLWILLPLALDPWLVLLFRRSK